MIKTKNCAQCSQGIHPPAPARSNSSVRTLPCSQCVRWIEDSAGSDKEWHVTGPIHCSTAFPRLWKCSFNTMTHNQYSPFHSAHHCGVLILIWISELKTLLLKVFLICSVLMLDLMLKKNQNATTCKRPIVLFHPAYKIMDLKLRLRKSSTNVISYKQDINNREEKIT